MNHKFFTVAISFLLSLTGTAQIVEKTVKLSTGIDMFYREAGVVGKEAVIFIHGYTDSGRSFYPTIDTLLRITPNIHVLAPDLRGHGRSSMPAEGSCQKEPSSCFEFTDFAEDILALLDHLRIEKAHIVGHSIGSAVSQEFALSHPDRVLSLTLIGSFVDLKDKPLVSDFLLKEVIEGHWKAQLVKQEGVQWPQDAYLVTPLEVDRHAEEWMTLNWVADPTVDPDFVRQMAEDAVRVPIGTWLGVLQSSKKFDTSERLKDLKARTLVLWAKQDMLLQDDPDQVKLRLALEKATITNHIEYYFKTYGKEPLPKSGIQEGELGHHLQWGAPGAVARDLSAFIQTGQPTQDLYYANPENPVNLVVEEDKAFVLSVD